MALKTLSQPSFASNLRALHAIALNDWRNFWRYPIDLIGYILQPIMWLAPVYFMGQAFSVNGEARGFAGYAGTSDYISFVILGSTLNAFISAVFWGIGFALKEDMRSGVLESNWLTPISRPVLLVGRTITNMLTTAITTLVALGLTGVVYGFRPTGSALLALVPVIPMLIGLYGFGLAFAALVLLMREANTLVDISSFLTGQFSGSQFPVQSLPGWMLPISLALPMTYGFDAARGFLLKTTTILPLRTEIAILVGSMFVLVALGLVVFNRVERLVRQRGTLGQY